MKKKRLAGLALLAPLCLLAACGGGGPTTLSVNPNWYADTTTATVSAAIDEKLTYSVTFKEPSDQAKRKYFVTYNPGTYTTELTNEPMEFPNGDGSVSSTYVYHYHTELHITGFYTYENTASETFEDYVISDVYFYGTGLNLRPIRSTKTVHSTNPVNSPGEKTMSDLYHFQYEVTYNTARKYNAELESAHIKRTDLLLEEGDENRVYESDPDMKVNYKGSYFDNEEILVALRALDMTEAVKFGTNNPQKGEVIRVLFSAAPSATTFSDPFTINGTPREAGDINAYKVQFQYDGTYSGTPRTALYAARTDAKNNLYRNVMLRLDDPISDGYGTLIYTLTSAEFH